MGLKEYNRKRDFKKTAEPVGKLGRAKRKSLRYLIQKHDASHLHYDFRLEMEGVLKSWAVPKGPSLDPSQKRLAMHVEDHPLRYGTFEGTIPKGEYGGGTVMLWDEGTWISEDENPVKALKAGSLSFELKGEKLTGRWKLVRMRSAGDKTWLLMKGKDDSARALKEGDILLEMPLSVKSQRDLPQIANKAKIKKKAAVAPSKLKSKRKPVRDTKPLLRILDQLQITHPEKVYFAESELRKIDLIEYYLRVAPLMLPHIAGRPLMIARCPEGTAKTCFFQKHWTPGFPEAIRKVKVKGEAKPFIGVDSAEGLISLAQIGCLEIHCWNSHFESLERPDQWVFDIDPDSKVRWEEVALTAVKFKKSLDKLGLQSFLKTTGGKGLHVVVPILPRLDWDLSKQFTKAICEDLAATNKGRYVVEMSKAKRTGRIFLDYFRNGRGSTAIAPYSPRSRLNAPIAVPISWKELAEGVHSDSFGITDIRYRIEKGFKDPWKDFLKLKQFPKRPIA